ncbi:MAG: c-type cytochrome [Gammaproteobacteria bacterium]|nr:c-type cytochrome [Alphaproteobacteria bacterium LMO-S08]WND75136.1 c-type cytochrome [Thalassospiraceae bacterium LMO-SO8]
MMEDLKPKALVLVAAAVGVISPTVAAQTSESGNFAQGRALYQTHCASCHGKNLEGQADWQIRLPNGRLPAPPHDRTGHTWHHPDEHLFRITKFGIVPPLAPEGYESDMPAFGDVLSDDEIWSALNFIKSTWPDRFQRRQQDVTRRAKKQ